VVTVGTGGDKMFWGRLAASRARVPVVLSALHSTGLPDHVELPNRLLAPLTDGFIAVAKSHGEYLTRAEGCPAHKVRVIPNGVDVDRFKPKNPDALLRGELGLSTDSAVVSIVAALRPEKNHELFLRAARRVRHAVPNARFLIVGDGQERAKLETLASELQISHEVRFLGTRSDIPELLALTDVVALSSHMEANPVSILEALACGKPVVATNVGSIPETVIDGQTGYLAPAGDEQALADRMLTLLKDRALARRLGATGRERVVANYSLEHMVRGYERLIRDTYASKCTFKPGRTTPANKSETKSPSPANRP
jgi:glycosyltransferase involved in cell wall biosynthesis